MTSSLDPPPKPPSAPRAGRDQELRRDAGAGRRRFRVARARDPRPPRGERGRQVHAVQGHRGSSHLRHGRDDLPDLPVRLRNTREALRVGIAIVMQETSLVPDLTVLENIFLPLLGRPGRLDYRDLRRRALEILSSLGQADALPLDREVRGSRRHRSSSSRSPRRSASGPSSSSSTSRRPRSRRARSTGCSTS